jgi:hypothetical protein
VSLASSAIIGLAVRHLTKTAITHTFKVQLEKLKFDHAQKLQALSDASKLQLQELSDQSKVSLERVKAELDADSKRALEYIKAEIALFGQRSNQGGRAG